MADNPVITEENKTEPAVDPVEQLKSELEQSAKAFEKSFVSRSEEQPAQAPKRKKPRYLVGAFSAALSFVVIGIAMIVSLYSPTGILRAFKIAPIALVFLGLEILLNIIVRKSTRVLFDMKSLLVCLAMILITFLLSLISLITTTMGTDRFYAESRLQNMLSHRLSESLAYFDNIRKIDIDINLYGDDPDVYNELSDLEDTDIINLVVNYQQAPSGVYAFSEECRGVMDVLERFDYAFGSVEFIADDEVNYYSLSIEWDYQRDMTTSELAVLVNYYGEDIDTDIPDLKDEETVA